MPRCRGDREGRLQNGPAHQRRHHNDLRSRGRSVSKDTLHACLQHLEDAFLVFTVSIDSDSEAVRTSNPRKVYPVDPGLARAHSFRAAADVGHLLETLVYLELRRRGFDCRYTSRSGYEVDFVARRPGHAEIRLVQVCARLDDPETRAREVRALTEAMEEAGAGVAEIVTLDETDEIPTRTGTIRVVPAWRWLLERRR